MRGHVTAWPFLMGLTALALASCGGTPASGPPSAALWRDGQPAQAAEADRRYPAGTPRHVILSRYGVPDAAEALPLPSGAHPDLARAADLAGPSAVRWERRVAADVPAAASARARVYFDYVLYDRGDRVLRAFRRFVTTD